MKSKIYVLTTSLLLGATLSFMSCEIKRASQTSIEDTTDTTKETSMVDSVASSEETEVKEQSPEQKIVGKYTFGESIETWIFTINEDGTCQLYRTDDPDGIWHGSWEYSSYNTWYDITWSSCDNPYEHLPFTSPLNYIDEDIQYIYAGISSIKAKDPNGRYELQKQ